MIVSCLGKNAVLLVGQMRLARLVEKATATPAIPFYTRGVQNTSKCANLVANGLQQQKTTPGPLLSAKNSETEDIICMGSTTWHTRVLQEH